MGRLGAELQAQRTARDIPPLAEVVDRRMTMREICGMSSKPLNNVVTDADCIGGLQRLFAPLGSQSGDECAPVSRRTSETRPD